MNKKKVLPNFTTVDGLFLSAKTFESKSNEPMIRVIVRDSNNKVQVFVASLRYKSISTPIKAVPVVLLLKNGFIEEVVEL